MSLEVVETNRANELFESFKDAIYRRTDKLFVYLMLLQWLGGIAAALVISPRTWTGTYSTTHIHVWAALFLGGAITSLPVYLALKRPGQVLTRHVIAIAQMLTSALLIHLTGGRIETHFHVFGSLAFLAFYRDWKVLVSATVVVTIDHFFRGMFWSQSVFGVLVTSQWRWLEHAGWVIFEDIFLFISIKQSLTDMRNVSERQAKEETLNHAIELRVTERTQELEQEIIERKKAVEALRGREELLRATLDSTADGILVVDSKGWATHWNIKFHQMWRIPLDVVKGGDDKKMLEIAVKQVSDPESFLTKIDEIYRNSEEAIDTIEFKDGRVFERFTCPLIRDGNLHGRVWNFRDVTKNREAERTRLELQEQLDKAQRLESLGHLAGGVAHDLNNTLGPVVGYSEMLVRDLPKGSKAAIRAGKIRRSAEEAAVVIQDLLTLARRGKYEMHSLNINEVIQSYLDSPAYENLKERNPNTNTKIRLSPSIAAILGSPAHLSKVVMNLVTNAIEAMPHGGTVSVDTEQLRMKKLDGAYQNPEGLDYIVLRIRDTGNGIAKEDISRIFEPYFSKKKMGHSGSGLGLSVVYGIVKDHKGLCDVQSEVGMGTEFILYFPVSHALNVPDKGMQDQIIGGSETILVVDDSLDQRELSREIIDSLGYFVVTADNGHAGVNFVKEQPVDLVILDMIMEPGFDGLDTYQEMLKINPEQRAIIVSGFSESDRVQEVINLGAGGFVKKPYSIDTLSKAIRSALDKVAVVVPD